MDIPTSQPYVPTPAPAPMPPSVTPAPAPAMHGPRGSRGIIAGVLIVAALVGYGAYAYFTDSWPFALAEPMASESPSPSVTPGPTAEWKTYTNTQYRLEVQYPPKSQVEVREINSDWVDIYFLQPDASSSFEIISYTISILRNGAGTTPECYSKIGEELQDGVSWIVNRHLCSAGGPGITFSAFTTKNGAKYELLTDGSLGDLRRFLSTFKFTDATSSVPADWKNFSSQYFTISFKVPPGFVVTDRENSIQVSRGPLEVYAIGSDNAFMGLQRYVNAPQSQAEAEYRAANRDVRASTITVDGSEFKRLDGTDIGSYEGESAGRTMLVIFDRSTLYVAEWSGLHADPPYDAISIAEQILATFRFAR